MFLIITPFLIYSAPLDHLASADIVKVAQIMPNGSSSGSIELKGDDTIILREARFSGNDAVTTEDLARIANSYLHRPFSQRDLRELRRQIIIIYKGKGYDSVIVASSIEQHYDHYVLFLTIKEGRRNPARQQ